ncbi:hypothetical protein Acr_22g0008690 [Actinidia rufa]|uniref:Uncharacterized protein n=1 Tax=Actinidia rufa TaxID=165716 RepID=A0A7J0GL49_9ERIC|nr:hypothetical protein Acr_22g0008690 [Actinidia rufa]
MGHTLEGCKENKTNSNKNEAAKPAGVAKETGKDTEAIAIETNDQIGTSGAGTNKGNQLEWVIKKTREGKGQKGSTEVRTITKTQTSNKFSPLEVILEIEENILQESGPVVEAEIQNGASRLDPATEESQNPNSRLEPEIEDSVSKALGLSTGLTPSIPKQQKKVQVGAAVNQAIQIASAELKTNLSQLSSTCNPTPAKGEEGKKNRDKKATVKSDKAISFAEFCAEMGDKVDLQILECSEQVIHCMVVLQDFNNVLHADERSNGQPVTQYEIRDFQQCCSKLGLVDTGYSGAHLTWTNNSTWSKLDRVMINNRWIADGLRAHAHFGFPGKLSDHSPSLVSLFENRIQGMQPFKFFNMWTLHEDFQRIVSMVWDNQVCGSAMFRLCRKLKFLKEPLKELNKKHFSHITSRAAAAEADLYEIQQKLHDNTSDRLLQEQMVKMKQTAFNLAEAERSYCSQLAKMKYLKNSDRGSKFFHDLIKIHRNRGQIVSINLSNGSRSKSQQEVNESFVEFYKNLLDSSSSCTPIDRNVLLEGRLMNDDQATALICAITIKKIKDSLFSIGDDKAPGPDAGISRDDLEAIKSISGISEGRFPFRYLGLPVASTKLTIAQFHPFTDRIAGYLNAWAGMKLSYAGRCELIRSILQGVECFWLASLYIPAGIRDRLIRMCRNFLWGGQCYVFKKALVAWESICLPKMEGGLGFKNLEAWNLALLSKNLWNIQAKKDSLWVRWIHLNHLQNSSIWDYNGRKQDSAMLRQVLSIRDKICELERSMQAVGTRMEQWVLDGRFCSKTAYEFFRPRKGNLTWPKWLGISRSMGTLKAAVKWIFKEARGTGIQAKAKRIGPGCGLEVLLPKTVAMVWYEIWLFLNSYLRSEFLPLLLEVMLMLRMQADKHE